MGTSYDDLMREAPPMRPASRLPWMLLLLTLAAGAASSLVLFRRIEALRGPGADSVMLSAEDPASPFFPSPSRFSTTSSDDRRSPIDMCANL